MSSGVAVNQIKDLMAPVKITRRRDAICARDGPTCDDDVGTSLIGKIPGFRSLNLKRKKFSGNPIRQLGLA